MKYPSKTQSKPDKRFFWAVGIIAIIISTIVAVVYSSKYQSPQPTEPATDKDSHYTSQDSTTTEPSSSPDQPSSTTSDSNSETPNSSPNSSSSKPSDAQDITPTTPTDNQSSHHSTSQENYTPMHEGGSSSNCLHYEAGRCWDDLEDEAYSTGLYDRQNGYYGASVYYDEDCDAICRDILDDAYDEGWYDNY